MVVNFFGGRKVHSQRKNARPQRKSWLRVWEKGPRLTLGWGPRMVNPALMLSSHTCTVTNQLRQRELYIRLLTLTSDLWLWKPFQQFTLTRWISEAGFIEISPPSNNVSRHAKQVVTDGRPNPKTYCLRIDSSPAEAERCYQVDLKGFMVGYVYHSKYRFGRWPTCDKTINQRATYDRLTAASTVTTNVSAGEYIISVDDSTKRQCIKRHVLFIALHAERSRRKRRFTSDKVTPRVARREHPRPVEHPRDVCTTLTDNDEIGVPITRSTYPD